MAFIYGPMALPFDHDLHIIIHWLCHLTMTYISSSNGFAILYMTLPFAEFLSHTTVHINVPFNSRLGDSRHWRRTGWHMCWWKLYKVSTWSGNSSCCHFILPNEPKYPRMYPNGKRNIKGHLHTSLFSFLFFFFFKVPENLKIFFVFWSKQNKKSNDKI